MTLLVIIGMHRSGTSLVARACQEAGVFGGAPEVMLESQADNPLGFYERRDLIAANEALLAATETRWYEPPERALISVSDVLSPLCEAVYSGLLEASGGRDAFIKDPRLCLTWPVWRSLKAVDHQVVIYVYRDPLAVARSLQARHGFPLTFGLSLWEHYNRLALAALRDSDFLCISYAQMASDPQALSGLLAKLQTRGVTCNPAAGAALFNPELQHSPAEDQVAGRLQSFEQTLLAEYCDALCDGGPLLPLPAPTPSLYEKIRDFAGALAPLSDARETRQRLDEARDLSDERTAERDRVLAEWKQLETAHETLAAAHKREVANHEHTVAQRDALNARHNTLIADHQAQQAELAALKNDLAALKNDLAELTDKSNYLFHELSQTYTQLLGYEQSNLARITRWVARAYKVLTGQRRENSSYDDVLANALQHMSDNALEMPVARPGKLAMLGDVFRYVASNPAGSLRSISWPRLRRGFSVFLGSSAADLQVWIDARFPEQAMARPALDPADLSPGLDNLELAFPAAESPRVSIVVPVFNDYRVTVHCLQSLLRHTAAGQYEVILADDGSDDLTASIESRLSGIQVVRGGNLGFLRNCNRAAEHARGEFIVLLNNDTAVTEGWLQALLKVFEQPSVGAAGPKLLFANGTLQESGGIMWRDGSAWNFGRMDDAARPAFNYVKDTDYISGACLMLRRALWQQLGGFDERFAPAYYEDADLCFAVRQAGYRVMYQPASAVFHFEGVSNGTDLTAGVKQHQVANQQVFADKWRSVLERDHFANAEHVVWARDRSASKPCVMFIDHYVPHYDRDAGSRSTFMYVKLLLNMGYRVQFMGANFFAHAPYTQDLQQLGVEVLVGESVARGLDAWLSEHASYIDQIFLHRPHVAEQFLPHLKKLPACPPINFVGHDLHYLRIGREAALLSDSALLRVAEDWRQREYGVFAQVDRIYYFSQAETDEIARHRPDLTLRTIPLHVLDVLALPSYTPSRPQQLLFVGGFNHPPNVDAARWFVEDILPRVTRAVPDCHLHLVGSNPNSAVEELDGDNVTVHGYVDDTTLQNLYREVGLAIVPLRYGAGVKGKVLEAVQHNVPLVTTTIGAEGIPEADAVMWIADEPEAIAVTVIGILDGSTDPAERMALYSDWLQKHFSCRRAEALLRQDFEPGQVLSSDFG